MGRRTTLAAALAAWALTPLALAGCGFDVQSPDLFLLTRTGQGPKLTLLVNDSGTIRCDGGHARPLADTLLISARDLSQNLGSDAGHHLTIARTARSVSYYRIRLAQGTVSFPDAAGATHPTLAQAELFATQAAQQACHLSG
ncbi:MAG: hypothetical protein ACRDLV_05780 [Solirubrobacteraceae bacterium]